MSQKKAREVDAWLARPDPAVSFVLLYGPDRGLVAERAAAFAAATGLPLDDPFSVVRLDAGEMEADPGRLDAEVRTVPMFAGRRLVWLRGFAAQKAVGETLMALLAEPVADALILVEAGDLKKGSGLRAAVEKTSAGMSLPCYADDGQALERLIDQELAEAGLAISLDARRYLKESLGGDRIASRGELVKLALYCSERQRIELDDVRAIVGDVSAGSPDDAVDAVLSGDVGSFDSAFSRSEAAGTPPFLFLSTAMRRFHQLQLMREEMEHGRKSAAAAVASARPPVFFARRPAVERALGRWSGSAIARVLERLDRVVLETRRQPALAGAMARQTLLAIAIESARRAN